MNDRVYGPIAHFIDNNKQSTRNLVFIAAILTLSNIKHKKLIMSRQRAYDVFYLFGSAMFLQIVTLTPSCRITWRKSCTALEPDIISVVFGPSFM